MNTIILNGSDLSRHQVLAVANNFAKVSADTSKLAKSRNYIENKVAENRIVYGVTTGFGSNVDKQIKAEQAEELQINLLRSHACGVGNFLPTNVVRAVMVIRLNTLLKGFSGIREVTVKQLEFLLNNNIHPLIPEQGSVGASGDLCPLSHMALPIIGEGEIEFEGTHWRTEDFIETDKAKQLGYKGIALSYKEGLALNNGTTVMAALATIALDKAERLIEVATLSSGMIFEGLGARKESFNFAKIHTERNHSGQIQIASWLSAILKDSKIVGITQKDILSHVVSNNLIKDESVKNELGELNKVTESDKQAQIPDVIINKLKANDENDVASILAFAKKKWKPQDSYSIRCIPQVFGASKTAIDHCKMVVENELNAAVDNPLIFPDDDKVISGGNFHGQPIALVMDYLKLAVSELGNIIERQVNKMVDGATNDCLPSFLVSDTGLNSGLMIAQYAAASIASENKVLVHPASADSIPTCENTEDHVSMGTISARQAIQIADNVERILAIAVLTGYYAFALRMIQFGKVGMENSAEKILSKATNEFRLAIKASNKFFANGDEFLSLDRFLSPEIMNQVKHFDTYREIAEKYISK